MTRKNLLTRCGFFVGLTVLITLIADVASAAPIATLTFRDRTGTVSPTDSIEVWLTLTLDPNSIPLTTDSTGQVTSGIEQADLDAAGIETVTQSGINNSFLCSGTFTSTCVTGPPYNFMFNTDPGSMVFPRNLDLQPGTSTDFLFGTFTPSGGPVAPGTYRFYVATLFFDIEGLDDGGNPVNIDLDIDGTCSNNDDACAFERTVVAVNPVPEPATFTLLSLGLAVVGRKYAGRER